MSCGSPASSPFGNGADPRRSTFPDMRALLPRRLLAPIPRAGSRSRASIALAVFIRLWRKLKESLAASAIRSRSSATSATSCTLFVGGTINPDFIRQLAAFQMLRDHFRLALTDPSETAATTAIDADRTHLLALWVGPGAAKWHWAVKQLIDGIEHDAQRRHGGTAARPNSSSRWPTIWTRCRRLGRLRSGLSHRQLARSPTHTLRFAEVLAKIYASDFSIGELLYPVHGQRPA